MVLVSCIPDNYIGVAGVIGSFFTVAGMAAIITFLPGAWHVRNALKINTCLKANVRGFLATL
jgi:hypothetical protein